MYFIKRAYFNGYRCGCCHRVWDAEDDMMESKEEAIAAVPKIPAKKSEHEYDDTELLSVIVVDGTDGHEVAAGHLDWPRGYGRSSLYLYTRWSGHIEGETFEHINGRAPTEGKTWAALLSELDDQKRTNDVQTLKKEIEDKINKLAKNGIVASVTYEKEDKHG